MNKRFSHGFSFLGSYVFSRELDDVVAHRQNHKFSQRLVKRLLEDRSIGAFHTIQSGAPLTFVMGTDVALNGTGQQNLQHAQLAAGKTYADIGLDHPDRNAYVNQFFNTAAFVPIAQLPKGHLRKCRPQHIEWAGSEQYGFHVDERPGCPRAATDSTPR